MHHKHELVSTKLGIGAAIFSVCGNVAFFSVGMGPVCWVLSTEIFPLRLRAQATALGAVGNRVSSGLVAMSFLSICRILSVAGTFFIFSLISVMSVVFVYKCVPEIKGKSLEQIEVLFQNGVEWKKSCTDFKVAGRMFSFQNTWKEEAWEKVSARISELHDF